MYTAEVIYTVLVYSITDILAEGTLIAGFEVSPIHSKGAAEKQAHTDHRQQPHPKKRKKKD